MIQNSQLHLINVVKVMELYILSFVCLICTMMFHYTHWLHNVYILITKCCTFPIAVAIELSLN